MNPKITISLVVVLALAVAALLMTQGDSSTTDDTHNNTSVNDDASHLISRDALGSELKRVVFDSADQGTILELQRIDGRWWVTAPHRFPAKTTAVDELLTQLSEMKGRPAKEDEHGGLVRGGAGIVLEHGDEETALYFSSRLGAGRAVITVILDDSFENINTTDALIDLFDSLNPDTFFSNRLNAPLMPEVGRIEIKTPEGESVLVQDDGRWWIETEQGRERALETGLPGYPGINNYFDLFKKAKLIEKQTSYPANGLASFGLENPLISTRFVPIGQDLEDTSNGYEIHIGTPTGPEDQTRYISNGKAGKATHPVFTIDTPTALAFAQDAKGFRDPRIMTIPRSLIESMAIKNVKGHYTIQFMSNGIQLVTSGIGGSSIAKPRNTRDGEILALALSQARAIDYEETDLQGIRAIASITMTTRLGGNPQSLKIYPDTSDKTVLVKTDEENKLRRVDRASITMLLETNFLASTQ